MSGHHHQGGPHLTQNQGNVLGDRPCVKQSRLYRELVSGNEMKGLLGQEGLNWRTDQVEGAYAGARVHGIGSDAYSGGGGGGRQAPAVPQPSSAPWATTNDPAPSSAPGVGRRQVAQRPSGGAPWAVDVPQQESVQVRRAQQQVAEPSVPPQRSNAPWLNDDQRSPDAAAARRANQPQSTTAPWAADQPSVNGGRRQVASQQRGANGGGVPWATDDQTGAQAGNGPRRGNGAANRQAYNILSGN